jgi:hypothetical protein
MVDDVISQAYLKSVLRYDPRIGSWTWRVHVYRSKMQPGDPAGYFDGRYNKIMIDHETYAASALAVLYMTGEWPETEVDHKDHDGGNDRWRNLRCVSESQNKMNRRRMKNSTTGFKWVSWHIGRNMYIASVSKNKKRKHLGYFSSAREAHKVARQYAERVHGAYVFA